MIGTAGVQVSTCSPICSINVNR